MSNRAKNDDNNDIQVRGIQTNNLKNINVTIPTKKITAIYGRSGAGKTSLAFSSVYKLCKDEFDSLEDGYPEENDYIVANFENIIPAVAIVQKNSNNNPRSTLFSYLNIAQILSFVKGKQSENNDDVPNYDLLKINKAGNECLVCGGIGEVSELDVYSIIDDKVSIEQKPFYCWKNGYLSEYYHELLLAFCEYKNIDTSKKFYQLPKKQQQLLLFSKSENKLSFRFKHKGKRKQRMAYYQGAGVYAQDNTNLKSLEYCITKERCGTCLGSRINIEKYEGVFILGIPFVKFITLPISDLYEKLASNKKAKNLTRVLKSICDIGLGYIQLSRSIPSLSGGELQKLRFSRLLHSNISNVLFIIDEISAQLNEKDYSLFLSKIKEISKNNTVVLVEHSQDFIDFADYKIHIGINAGKQGGYICEHETISPIKSTIKKNNIDKMINLTNLNNQNVINQNLSIPQKCLTVFRGVSGSGKSSLAKAIQKKRTASISAKESQIMVVALYLPQH